MRFPARLLPLAVLFPALLPVCAFGPNDTQTATAADIIVTAAPVYAPLAALKGGDRFPKGAQLLLIHDGKPESLVPSFAASADANISFDGQRALFSGKQSPSDPWQIWEVTLKDRSVRKLIAADGDAIRPFYLPAGRLVYARHTTHGFQLEVAGKDDPYALATIDAQAGKTILPLTYLPISAVPTDVLKDGRILFESNFPLGVGTTPELFLVYSDGSGVESYRCDHGRARWGGKQIASGDVVFTHGTSLARFTSPLAHEEAISTPHAEFSGAIAELPSGNWLVSARSAATARFALNQFEPGSPALQAVLTVDGQNLVDPVVIAPRTRPKRHPSGLHDWNYANLLALDARQSREGDLKITPAQVRLQTIDAHGHPVAMGTAPIESDGSFFVQTPSDKPIRFALLNQKGEVVRQERGWFWIRSGEQRICVGCHTGPERSSENHVPAVLLRTTTPVNLTGKKPQASTPGGN
jgi:hypothetical protein